MVVLSAAMAAAHRFYSRFAAGLATGGYTTVTYDYRGIGGSAPAIVPPMPAMTGMLSA